MSSACPFCPENWANLDFVSQPAPGYAIIRPLNPVTDGHVLVITDYHTADAASHSGVAAQLMRYAASYCLRQNIQANIITSIGPDATQTVRHTHVHVVPRRPNDGLPLPWTPQQDVGQ